jgi:hypothetical protein
LAFIYTGKPYFYKERILCMAQYLFEVEQANRLEQKGVLRRFTMECVGKQESLIDIRGEKARKFRELKKGTAEYNEWFLKYNPATDKEPLLDSALGKKGDKKEEEVEKGVMELNKRKSKKYNKKPVHRNPYKTRRFRKSSRSVYFY